MEIVLGVSMTPTTVSIALVEGEKADGVIVERDVFDITAIDGSATSSASDHVIAAVLGTQEGAIAAGHHLVSTGVPWTDHAQVGEDDTVAFLHLHGSRPVGTDVEWRYSYQVIARGGAATNTAG